MTTKDKEDGVLSRWSKRKRGLVKDKEIIELSEAEEQELLDAHEAELEANREAAEAIDLDTIDEESDLSLFMKEGVPETLKKAALAKLWRSNPVFANVDGLVDYDDNFADPNLIMKTFTSAYQVGKGYLKEILEDVEETAVAENVSSEQQETVEPAGEEEEAATTPDAHDFPDADKEETQTIVVAEELDDEPETMPKVSLRKRLSLEG
ncbi:MAG: DUF3306 domain-containing protein [Pseudomonadota bacterium]